MTHLLKDDTDPGVLPEVSSHQHGDPGELVGQPLSRQEHPVLPLAGCVDSLRKEMPSSQANEKGSRLLVLDGLRALAICLVLFHHYSQKMGNSGMGDRLFFSLSNSAWIGVDLFFVLSGFLITGILYDAKGSPSYFRTFYIRRSLRIFPIYYVLLLVIFVILPFFHHSIVDSYTLDHQKWFWLYGSNYLTAFKGWPDIAVAHLWSLAIEEHFYLLWPVVVFLGNKRQLLIGGTALLVGAILLRFYSATHDSSADSIYVMTHYRIDTLVTGGLLALAWRTPAIRSKLERHAGKATVILLVAGFAGLNNHLGLDWLSWSPVQQAAGFTLIALFFAAFQVVCLQIPSGSIFYRILTCAPALWLGRLSYGMYLFHRPIEVLAMEMGLHPSNHIKHDIPNWTYVLVYILGNTLVTALLAWLTWNLFEKHILRLKDRFIYQKS